MSYNAPSGDNVNFEVSNYTPPSGSDVDFYFDSFLIVANTEINKKSKTNLITTTRRNLNINFEKNNTTIRNLTELEELNIDSLRKLNETIINNFDSLRKLSQLFSLSNQTQRSLFEVIYYIWPTLRGIGDPFSYIWPTSRILPESNQLCWQDRRPKKQLFKPNIWSYTENTFEEFNLGEHLLTKAFTDDYLGLIDDYSICWGPSEEGEGLSEYQHVYNSRLYIVYTTETGKVNLAKSDIGGNEIVSIEELTFAPSGSQQPSITFNPNGYYEIAVEVKPAGTETKEVWLFSYPYEGDSIRQICNGVKPNVSLDHNSNLTLFYQLNNDKTTIKYRRNDDSYSTEYDLAEFNSEREVQIVESKLFKSEENNINYILNLLMFAYRSDDTFPYKYAVAYDMKTKPQYKNEKTAGKVSLDSINWNRIYHLNNNQSENTAGSFELENIYWQPVADLNKIKSESTNGKVDLNNIDWNRIYHLNSTKNESAAGEVSLSSILWIKP